MISEEDKIIEEREFVFGGEKLIARLYNRKGKGAIYGEIVKSSNNERVENIKGVAREYLKKYKINIPMDAETVVTHNAVKMLITELKNEDKE